MQKRFSALVSAAMLLTLVTAGCTGAPAGQRSMAPAATAHEAELQLITADIENVPDENSLIESATLILVGTPAGKAQEIAISEDGLFVDYLQSVQVKEVLKGEAPEKRIQVVRHGVASEAVSKQRLKIEDLRGPLSPGKQILFLQPSGRPDAYQVVGHAAGEMPLDAGDRVLTAADEAAAFKGLTPAQVRLKIGEMAKKPK